MVAAVGNGDEAPTTPWKLRELPGRAAPRDRCQRARAGRLRAGVLEPRRASTTTWPRPGVGIVSTLPRALTAEQPACADQGYSICGPPEFRTRGRDLVRRRAGLRRRRAAARRRARRSRPTRSPRSSSVRPTTSSAGDGLHATCALGRDSLQRLGRARRRRGAGVRSSGPIPPADRYEANDDAGDEAFALYGRSRRSRRRSTSGTTRSTSTASSCARVRPSRSSLAGRPGTRHEPDPLAAGHAAVEAVGLLGQVACSRGA